MAAVLQQVLERTELSRLPKTVQNKLEKYISDQQSEIDSLKAQHEQFRVDSGEYNNGNCSILAWLMPDNLSPLASYLAANVNLRAAIWSFS